MLEVRARTFKTFDLTIAAFDGLMALVYLTLFVFQNLDNNHLGISVYTTLIGTGHILYMFSLYVPLKKRSLPAASLIGASLFISNLAVLVLASGGFSSPFYALWLITILVSGIYRPSVPLGLIGLSTLYFGGYILGQPLNPGAITDATVALGAAYITGGLGFWLWHSQHTKYRTVNDLNVLNQQLTQEQIKSEVLLEHIGEGVIVIGKTGKVNLLNPAGVALTGWPDSEAKGLGYRIILPLSTEEGSELTADDDIFALALAQKKIISRDDVYIQTRSQKKIALSITVSPITSSQGKVTGGIAVFRDVSQNKTAERQRNEFISTASHEMRTPVAAVEGYIALALNSKVAQVDENARKYLQKAQASTQHLGKLFQDLLAITRIEEGKLPSHPEVVDPVQIIAQVIDELRFKAEKKSLKLRFNSGITQTAAVKNLSPLYYIYVDPERLREVLINLADNAIKFTTSGVVEVTLDGDEDNVILGVKDSGVGIATEDLPHLFQKFYRINNEATKTIGGTGLGLYITRAIVEMYQGRIWVETAPGKGSHFKISLPRLDYAKAQELLEPQAPTSSTTLQSSSPVAEPPKSAVAPKLNLQVE